jgi:polyisoprenoid-binding protein YceI
MTVQPNQAIDPSQFAGKWTLDGSRSSISFRASSLWGLMKVRGKFTRLRGEAIIEPNGSVRGQLVVDASSMHTGNTKRDNHLRSDDFFKVAKHPEIVFELSGIVPGSDEHRLTGTLRIIGNSQPLQLTARIRDLDASGLTLYAQTTVDRSRWGVTYRKNGMVNMNTGLEISARFNREG